MSLGGAPQTRHQRTRKVGCASLPSFGQIGWARAGPRPDQSGPRRCPPPHPFSLFPGPTGSEIVQVTQGSTYWRSSKSRVEPVQVPRFPQEIHPGPPPQERGVVCKARSTSGPAQAAAAATVRTGGRQETPGWQSGTAAKGRRRGPEAEPAGPLAEGPAPGLRGPSGSLLGLPQRGSPATTLPRLFGLADGRRRLAGDSESWVAMGNISAGRGRRCARSRLLGVLDVRSVG